MALQISTYVDPGVYVGEVVVPGAVNVANVPFQVGIIGPGSRIKRITNEAVVHGLVSGEDISSTNPLQPQMASSPHTAVLGGATAPKRGSRRLQQTTVFRDGKALSDSFLTYEDATILGTVAGPYNIGGAASTSEITFVAAPGAPAFDAETFSIDDGVNPPVVFEFDLNGAGVTPGNVAIVYTGTETAQQMAEIAGAAVNAVGAALEVTAGTPVAGVLPLTHDVIGGTNIATVNIDVTDGGFSVGPDVAAVAGAGNVISLSIDGKVPLTIVLTDAGGVTSVQGTTVTVNSEITALATASRAEIANAINEALNPTSGVGTNAAVTALGYGAAYAGSAIDATTGVRINSLISTPSSDVRLIEPVTASAVSTIFGAPSLFSVNGESNREATTFITIKDLQFNAASEYTIDYIGLDERIDATANSNNTTPAIRGITAVGTDPSVGNFEETEDYQLLASGPDADELDWTINTPATYTSGVALTVSGAGTLNTSADATIAIGIDGRAVIDILLAGLAPAPLSYAEPVNPLAMTAAEVANNINAVLAESALYGAEYANVADTVADNSGNLRLRITSPEASLRGERSGVVVGTPSTAPTDDATAAVWGTIVTPVSRAGDGREPAQGGTYFVSYEIDRPATDYNRQKRFFSLDQARADLGTENAQNPIMIAAVIAFRNGAPSIVVVQANDSSLPGSPTRQELNAALEVTAETDIITEVCVLSTDLAVQIDVKDHIEQQSGPIEKHYRRGWFGMARNTDIGDRDTPDTYVYRSVRTLQVGPTSPGRGRMILVAPPQRSGVSIDLRQDDGSTERVALDSTYLAVGWAAKRTSFQNPSESLARETIAGFNLDDVTTPWLKRERQEAQRQGSLVTLFDAGNFTCIDPVTTEQGGGGLAAFNYPSTSSQKDNVTRRVTATLDTNVVGVVPTELSDFIVDIKLFIQGAINAEIGSGSIAPFRDQATGVARPLSISTDIEVTQDRNDPTKFYFRYYYFLKYPALRLLGEFSVDNPFFVTQA